MNTEVRAVLVALADALFHVESQGRQTEVRPPRPGHPPEPLPPARCGAMARGLLASSRLARPSGNFPRDEGKPTRRTSSRTAV